MHEAHLDETEEGDCRFLITSKQPAALLKPADEALEDVATTVRFAIKVRMPRLGTFPTMRVCPQRKDNLLLIAGDFGIGDRVALEQPVELAAIDSQGASRLGLIS